MKLEDKFFNVFFYPYFIGVIISITFVIIIISHFSKGYLDERTGNLTYDLETKYAQINIYSANVIITNIFLKIQLVLQEQLNFFELASKTFNSSTDLNKEKEIKDVHSIYEDPESPSILNRLEYASMWFVDPDTKYPNASDILYKQLFVFSLITQSMYANLNSMKREISKFYFIFEDTNLFAVYPYKYYYNKNSVSSFGNYTKNPSWCTDDKGNIINYYRFKCRNYYNDIMKTKTSIFDNNVEDQKNRKIYITSPYTFFGSSNPASFTMCIEFTCTLTNTNAFICADIEGDYIFNTFDIINDKLLGYFSISSVGFNNVFYFPHITTLGTGKTICEYIYNWNIDYFLEEKMKFIKVIQKQLTSNYIRNFNDKVDKNIGYHSLNVFNEINVNNDTKKQYFYVDDEKYEYKIFPVILENYQKEKEHVLSIIYIFKDSDFYEYILGYESDTYSQLALQLILFAFFGTILLYIIVSSFGILAKYIVIPIKNVHYMLEGINVGGDYRLEYLNDLKKRQEVNLEKLNKINQQISKKKREKEEEKIAELTEENNKKQNNKKDNKKDKDSLLLNEEIKNNVINDDKNNKTKNQNKNEKTEEKLSSSNNDLNLAEDNMGELEFDGEIIDPNINYDKQYDIEGDKIEKELNFYGFDEELLQYRPIEIDRLVQSLLNLKSALLMTSSEQDVEQIIGYSNSEFIFSSYKNKEGAQVSQSNIGNLQSRLDKYDKAIFHLALSLENIELKKFFSQKLSDEFDDDDILLNRIEMSYQKEMKGKQINILAKKQQKTGHHKKISQNFIETLINSRYNKLIYFYYKFFSSIQKSNYNYEKLFGCFTETNYHTIDNYHRILMQYIYLCFISNDLVKIGESILDYLEFLIKFKLKTSEENGYKLNIKNKDIPEIKTMQNSKKKYFEKILTNLI